MKVKIYILGAYLLILLVAVSNYYLIEEVRLNQVAISSYVNELHVAAKHIWYTLQGHLNAI